jgi:uncharacterized protein
MAFNIMKFFQPKDKIFYGLFEQVVETNVTMSKKLKELVNTPDFQDRQNIISQLEELEHRNDDTTHQLFTELGKNFITPFDREDIHALATSLDDIADYIYATAKKINFYKVNPLESGFQKMADIIDQATESLKSAVTELRNMKNIGSITATLVLVNSLENQADDIYDMCIEQLFATENDVKEIIKKREIYQVMENATDKCEDAANVIESIIIKYA